GNETLDYAQTEFARVLARVRQPTPEQAYFVRLVVFHEDMHAEAFNYTRQTLGYARPQLSGNDSPLPAATDAGALPGDAYVPGGTFFLGAAPGSAFVFDNEKWAHPVAVAPFRIARAAVTNREYANF